MSVKLAGPGIWPLTTNLRGLYKGELSKAPDVDAGKSKAAGTEIQRSERRVVRDDHASARRKFSIAAALPPTASFHNPSYQ